MSAEDPMTPLSQQEQLRILRIMVPDLKRYLVPSKVISDLHVLLGEDKCTEIQDAEQESRIKAVEMLMEAVLAKKEDGLSHFMHALELVGDDGWKRFLNPLENQRVEEIDMANVGANEYFHFILKTCLQGEIIRTLTQGELDEIMIWLVSQDVLEQDDVEEIRGKGLRKGALQLFNIMPRYTPEWPLKFFVAIQHVKPKLLKKIDPLKESPLLHKESYVMETDDDQGQSKVTSHRSRPNNCLSDSEQTLPKRPRVSDDEDRDEDTLLADSDTDSTADELESFSDLLLNSDDDEKPDDDKEKPAAPPTFDMHQFQHELAAPSLAGCNNIICAPTGSGKTRVALYIVQQHLRLQRGPKRRKVVFLANKVPLVQQQFKIFEKFLSHEHKCVLASGDTGNRDNLHLILDDYDILVMTPKILENNLGPDKIPSLSAFSLIVFDECHNTRKGEPYNTLMKKYLESKEKGERDLPQIVGLTASIGVEKATTVTKAAESIVELMANLDVTMITQVEKHKDELERLIPKPAEEMEELSPRTDDIIKKSILSNMEKVERMIEREFKVKEGLSFLQIATIYPLFQGRPAQRHSQRYGQWATRIRRKASSIYIPRDGDPDTVTRLGQFVENVQRLAESLVVYSDALDVHDLTRPVDVLDFVKRLVEPRYEPADFDPPKHSSEIESQLYDLVSDLQTKTKKFASSTGNPNLSKLSDKIITHMDKIRWEEPRVMIFVRTRATCQALCNWLNSENVDKRLKKMKASPFTGTSAPQDNAGMTQPEQDSVVKKFREGEVKLLVCTTIGQEGIDIPDCSLVIRYNHVGNEVATVQTRGRSRKVGGLSVLLAMPHIINKEQMNKRLVEIMHKALIEVQKMRSQDVSNQVAKAQLKSMNQEKSKKIAMENKKKGKKKEALFTLECRGCRKVKVDGSSIRKINGAHHVILGRDLEKRGEVEVKRSKKPRNVDNIQFTGEILCNMETKSLKPTLLGNTMKSEEVEYLALKAESWVVVNNKGEVEKSGKWHWVDVDYEIPELVRPDDVRAHLGLPVEEEGARGGGDN